VGCAEELLSSSGEVTHAQLVFALSTLEAVPVEHFSLDFEAFQLVYRLVADVTHLLGSSKSATHGEGDDVAQVLNWILEKLLLSVYH